MSKIKGSAANKVNTHIKKGFQTFTPSLFDFFSDLEPGELFDLQSGLHEDIFDSQGGVGQERLVDQFWGVDRELTVFILTPVLVSHFALT